MRTIALITIAFAALSASFTWCQEQDLPRLPDAETSKRIGDLIKQLDAEKSEAREAATGELRKIGEPALPLLEKLISDPPNLEVKFRAQSAVDGIKLDLVRRQALKVDDILAEARAAQKEDWDKAKLEAQLDGLIRILAEETGKKELKLPVTFSELGQAVMGRLARGSLIKEKRAKISSVEKSIVLCDSIADISIARHSIIIAPLAVCISHCEDCLVITGRLVATSHTQNSIVLCNSRAEISFARQSILAGPEAVNLSHAEGSVFVNSAAPPARFPGDPREPNRAIEVKGIVFGEKSLSNQLEGKLTVTYTYPSLGDRGLALFRLPDGTGEYVTRVDQEIKTPQGEPIESLKGWRLIYSGNRLAVFANGEEIACVRQEM